MYKYLIRIYLLISLSYLCNLNGFKGCKIESERLKSYTRNKIERLLDVEELESIYWPDEPLDERSLSKALNLNVTMAETQFSSSYDHSQGGNEVRGQASLIREMFVSCSTDRDGHHILTINMEIDNPFKTIEARFNSELSSNATAGPSKLRILLPDSSLLVQFSQLINYDECLEINYVQFEPNIEYVIDCYTCDVTQRVHMEKLLGKRMTQMDNELDSMISSKVFMGLQTLLSQQRLDLDLYLK